jgi:hypothetical protein
MRELHAWHGDRRHHAADAAVDTPVTRAHDSPKHDVLRHPAARVAEHLEYRKIVEAQLKFAAEQPEPKEGRLDRAPPEARDNPAGKIAKRRTTPENQQQKQATLERSWLPSDATMQVAAGTGVFMSSVADAVNVLPGRWDAVVASFLGAVVAGVGWGNKRWKGRNGNRPED